MIFDKANVDPFALAMKTSLVLRGAVRSDMHRSFGLADLEEGQDLDGLRKGEGDYTPIPFDPPALADEQASHGVAAPGILSKMLGDYYYDVLGRIFRPVGVERRRDSREDRRKLRKGL